MIFKSEWSSIAFAKKPEFKLKTLVWLFSNGFQTPSQNAQYCSFISIGSAVFLVPSRTKFPVCYHLDNLIGTFIYSRLQNTKYWRTMPYFRYVPSDEFTPESRINWLVLGKVEKWTQEKDGQVDRLSLYIDGNHKVYIYILSPASFRVRFNPNPEAPLVKNRSPATIVDMIEECKIKVTEEQGKLVICTCKIEVCGMNQIWRSSRCYLFCSVWDYLEPFGLVCRELKKLSWNIIRIHVPHGFTDFLEYQWFNKVNQLTNWRQFFMRLSCYWSWMSSSHCQSSCGSTRR